MLYIGLDPTDPFAKLQRPVTRASMTESLTVVFDEWTWAPGGQGLLPEDRRGLVVAIDGPQGLATLGSAMRDCERLLRAPGKTPDRPPWGTPFAGFIRGSVDLFAALAPALPPPRHPADRDAQLLEVYPGAAWPLVAAGRLPKKQRVKGREMRADALRALGLRFSPDVPSHDELDAALAAYTAWCFRSGRADCVGLPPYRAGDALREGYIVQPRPA